MVCLQLISSLVVICDRLHPSLLGLLPNIINQCQKSVWVVIASLFEQSMAPASEHQTSGQQARDSTGNHNHTRLQVMQR